MTMMMIGLMTAAGTPGVLAHSGAVGIIKERMDTMVQLGKSMKVLAAHMGGKVDYDAGQVKSNAKIIKSHAGDAFLKLFPEGSNAKPSEAKSIIWADWETFSSMTKKMFEASEALELVAENKGAAGQAAFSELAKTCSSCHKVFRQKK